MASCVAFSCSCIEDTCPSNVARAAINGATSGSVGCGKFVSRLNVTPALESGIAGTAGTTGSAGSSTLGTLAGATLSAVDGVACSATVSGLLAASPPFMERVLKSSSVVVVTDSSSRVRYVISATAEGLTVMVGMLSISTPDDSD